MPRVDLGRVIIEVVATVTVVVLVDIYLAGIAVFSNAKIDAVQHVDAIVVLSGNEHDGREDYGLRLAHEGLASTVVFSNLFPADDPVMSRVCKPATGFDVICAKPSPSTTRGEAMMMRDLAKQRSWKRIIVISWRYHLPRARLVFRQCFSDQPGSTVMLAVPRRYDLSILQWEFIYAYQFAGLAKAVLQGNCTPASDSANM
jgi:uncharacterized SAM-binding protein YcdF (DUF218 family)